MWGEWRLYYWEFWDLIGIFRFIAAGLIREFLFSAESVWWLIFENHFSAGWTITICFFWFGDVWFVWANYHSSPTNQEGSVVDACVAWHRTRLTVWQLIALAEPPFHAEIWIFWSFYLEVSNRKRASYSQEPAFIPFAQTTILSKRWKTFRTIWQVIVAVTTPTKVATSSNLGAKFWFICSTGV